MSQLLVDTPIDPEQLSQLAAATGLRAELAPGELDAQRELPGGYVDSVQAMLCTLLPLDHQRMTSQQFLQRCSAGFPMPPEHLLWQMKNVIMTPHISGSSESPHFKSRRWPLFGENVRRWQSGQPLLNALSQHQLEPDVH